MKKRVRCIRCESLERPQRSKAIYLIKNSIGELIPLCAVCMIEVKEEEDFFKLLKEEEDEPGGESFNQ